ncbi:hypothetical protein AVEN_10640-1, partial [Araneus ventricosus]
ITKNIVYPGPAEASGSLNDSRCNSFDYQGRIPSGPSPGHGLTPSKGGTCFYWWRDQEPHNYCTPRGIKFLVHVHMNTITQKVT